VSSSNSGGSPDTEFDPDRVVIRDNRKIDPVTGEARKPAGGVDTPLAEPAGEEVAQEGAAPMVEASLLDERTADLQRVQAEYANYRKRADRERLAASDLAVGRTLAELLPVIDDLDRAKAHGDLTGPLKAVADKLDSAFAKLGLVAFGEVGDPFDPAVHEAVLHDESDTVTEPTCTTVMRQGYKHHDRLLRPAMVGVTDPATFALTSVPAEAGLEDEPKSQGKHSETRAEPDEDAVPTENNSTTSES
jgi:molecular chaperone GrpE